MILFTLFTAVKVLTFMIVAIQKTINHHQLLELAIKMTQKCAPNAEFSGVQMHPVRPPVYVPAMNGRSLTETRCLRNRSLINDKKQRNSFAR